MAEAAYLMRVAEPPAPALAALAADAGTVWAPAMVRDGRVSLPQSARMITFKDVNVEELDKTDLRLPESGPFGA